MKEMLNNMADNNFHLQDRTHQQLRMGNRMGPSKIKD